MGNGAGAKRWQKNRMIRYEGGGQMRLRRRMWKEETAGMEGHLGVAWKPSAMLTTYSMWSLQTMRVMNLQLAISCHQMILPIPGQGFNQLSCWTKRIKWKSPNNSDYFPDHKLFSTNWLQGPIAKDSIHIIHWTWIGQTGAYIKPYPPCCSVFGTERSSAGYSKRKVNTKPSTKPLI